MSRLLVGTEMVRDQDAPYLSIVGRMLTVAMGDPEEYIGAVTLMSMLGIEYGSGVPVLVMIHVLECGLRSRN